MPVSYTHLDVYKRQKVDYPDIDTVMDAVDAAEGIAVLAHPSEYHSRDLLRELGRNHRIRGIEVYHPRNTEAVSYTHLDVYKRQSLRCAATSATASTTRS